jgi:hypothetical protein
VRCLWLADTMACTTAAATVAYLQVAVLKGPCPDDAAPAECHWVPQHLLLLVCRLHCRLAFAQHVELTAGGNISCSILLCICICNPVQVADLQAACSDSSTCGQPKGAEFRGTPASTCAELRMSSRMSSTRSHSDDHPAHAHS